jgi:hypothetical protein
MNDSNQYNQASGFFFMPPSTSGARSGDWQTCVHSMGASWASNYGFQLQHDFHNDAFGVRRVTNGGFAGWREILTSANWTSYITNNGYANAMNQHVRTSDSPTFADVTISSDSRLKEDIETIDNALQTVESLRGVQFKLKNALKDRLRTGVIAQEIEQVLPDAVVDGVDGYKKVSYNDLIGVLIEAIKELSEKVKNLENK